MNGKNKEGRFVNMLNETINYTNWAPVEPDIINNQNKDCVVMDFNGIWHNASCFKNLSALCSQRHSDGKCSECQFRWLVSEQITKQIL